MAWAASPRMRTLDEGAIQLCKGVPVIKGHFNVLSIMWMILVNLCDSVSSFAPHVVMNGETNCGSQPENSILISSNAHSLFQVLGCDLSTWDKTMLKDFPAAIVYVIT